MHLPDPRTLTIYGNRLMLCPICGFEFTHIDRVSMLDAAGHSLTIVGSGEDEACVMTVETTAPAIGIGRRHAIVLEVDCEGCDNRTLITFRQHKGQTEIETHIAAEPETHRMPV